MLFPHIPRKFSASLISYTEKIGLWSLFSALILANLYAKANLTLNFRNKIVAAIQNPLSIGAHVDLAQALWRSGFATAAQKELNFASAIKVSLPTNARVLGVSTADPDVILSDWQHERSNLESEYSYWQGLLVQKPDYRDASVMLISLAYQLGKIDEEKFYLNQLISLDPNFKLATKLSSLLTKQ